MFSFAIDTIIILGTLLASLYIFFKATKLIFTKRNMVLFVAWGLVWGTLYVASQPYIPLTISRAILCLVTIVFLILINKEKIEVITSGYLFSFGIAYVFHIAASLSIGFVFMVTQSVAGQDLAYTTDFNSPIYMLMYSLIAIFQLALSALFFRIRRFKNGFPFLFKKFAIVATLMLTGAVLILATAGNVRSTDGAVYAAYIFLAGIIITGFGIYILIRRGIKIMFKRQVLENRIEQLQAELAEARGTIEKQAQDYLEVKSESHNIAVRLKSAKQAVLEISKQGFVTEDDSLLEYLQNLSTEYGDAIGKASEVAPLPSTNLPSIDRLFRSLQLDAAASNIAFNLNINGSVRYMVEKLLPLNKLETLIGDHVSDAIIAVNSKSDKSGEILVKIGEMGDFSGLCVYDDGIEFEVDTLLKLGTEPVTTYADKGGSGLGFYHTFNTIMKEYGASIIIDEKEPGEGAYTKSVTILFDGQRKYVVNSYRSDELNNLNDKEIAIIKNTP